ISIAPDCGIAGTDSDDCAAPGENMMQGDGMALGKSAALGESAMPEGVRFVPYPPAGAVDVVVTLEECGFDTSLLLKPKEYVIGMGCKKGKKAEEIEAFITKKTGERGIAISQISALASISQKSDEPGLLAWSGKEGVPFFTYTAEELQMVEGNFTESSFVKTQVCVDNVCERAALKACGEGGELIAAKYAENGMTIAVAKRRLPKLEFCCG
ncbi:MAG: cobalamin biosynthesis protein, partial [Lachnospiraceae bacterium]|nr:cobalamin biosynthesis protein [Lachnospiraceae bacterium]